MARIMKGMLGISDLRLLIHGSLTDRKPPIANLGVPFTKMPASWLEQNFPKVVFMFQSMEQELQYARTFGIGPSLLKADKFSKVPATFPCGNKVAGSIVQNC
jgi:hypothetical protein